MRRNENSPPVTKDELPITATDVTGMLTLEVPVQRNLPVEVVARQLANRLALPEGHSYALRDEESSVYLDETRPIGEQLAPKARVAVTPRTHLG